jgi:hypothetical protein
LTGRALADDVIDVELLLIFGGEMVQLSLDLLLTTLMQMIKHLQYHSLLAAMVEIIKTEYFMIVATLF